MVGSGWWWFACAADPGTTSSPPPTADTEATDTGPTSPTDSTPPTDSTATTVAPDPCAPDAAVSVTAAAAANARLTNQKVVSVSTSADAAVAVRCTSAGDPTDVHLLEDDGGSEHVFDLGGLLTNDHYDCLAVPTCPQGTAAPVAFGFDTLGRPPDLQDVVVDIDPVLGMTGAYTMFNLELCEPNNWDWIQLVDPEGRTRWWHAVSKAPNMGLEVRHQGDGVIVWGGGYTNLGRPRRVDVFRGEIYDSATTLLDYGSTTFHHDGKQLADGRILTLETETTWSGPSYFEGFAVRLHDPDTQTVSWEYQAQTAVDAGELDPGAAAGDVWHANWADVAVESGGDKLYVSLCYYYQVLKIDPVAGAIEWTFGPGGDFTLQDVNGDPLDESEFSQCQHGLEVSGDHLLVYDNGWDRGYTRVSEYALDTTTMTATLLWTWNDGFSECCLGDADYLDNGRILAERATFACGSEGSKVYEIDPVTGAVASTVSLRRTDASYRAERLDGCELFANTAYCPDLAARAAELAPIFAGDASP